MDAAAAAIAAFRRRESGRWALVPTGKSIRRLSARFSSAQLSRTWSTHTRSLSRTSVYLFFKFIYLDEAGRGAAGWPRVLE